MKRIKVFIFAIVTIFILLIFFQKIVLIDWDTEKKHQYNIKLEEKNSMLLTTSIYIIKPIIENYIDSRLSSDFFIKYTKRKNFANNAIKTIDINIGNGKSVLCGQNVTVHISEQNKSSETITAKVGNFEKSVLNIGLIGMKKNGTRIIKNSSNEDTVVMLIDVLDKYPSEFDKIRVFSSVDIDKKAHMCGEEIEIEYSLMTIYGENILKNKISFKIGSGEVPFAIEYSSLEIQKDNPKTVITPISLLKTNKNMKEEIINQFKNLSEHFYILEISIL